jgi:hypothetical protein
MAKATKQTNIRGYPSKYSPEKFVTASQYIIELICEKKAATNDVTLPIRFWRLPEWAKFFKFQSLSVNAFLKTFDERAIIRALKRSGKMWSLRTQYVKRLIKEEAALIILEDKKKLEAASKQSPPNRNTVENIVRPLRKGRSTMSLLQDLEENG